MTPLIIIGDVHGDVNALRRMLSHVRSCERKTVFLGDYVNGGANSAEVIEELATLKAETPSRWVFLAGNHDLALMDYLEGGDFRDFARLGGVVTAASYLSGIHTNVREALSAAMPAHHGAFLRSLSSCYEEHDLLVSHTGFDTDHPADRSFEAMARKSHSGIFSSITPRDLVVCGHYRRWDNHPFVSEHLICIDTGCGISNGPLSAIFLPERTICSL